MSGMRPKAIRRHPSLCVPSNTVLSPTCSTGDVGDSYSVPTAVFEVWSEINSCAEVVIYKSNLQGSTRNSGSASHMLT